LRLNGLALKNEVRSGLVRCAGGAGAVKVGDQLITCSR